MADVVVVGGGPGAVRAAGALRRAGRRVVLVQEGQLPGGVSAPAVPVGLGIEEFAQPAPGWREVRGLGAGLVAGPDCGCVHALPLSRAVLPSLFDSTALPSALSAWGRARGAVELARLLGGGKETRTYRDWVVQHFGEPVHEALYAPYCRRRFGEPDEVTVNVARFHHGYRRDTRWYAHEAGPAARLAHDLEGVEVVLGAEVRALDTGRVSTALGDVEGEVYVDLPPRRVVDLLGDRAPGGLANEVSRLRCRHALEVTLRGGHALPFVTHLAAGPLTAYRLVRHGLVPGNPSLAGQVSVQMAVEDGTPAWTGRDDTLVAECVDGLRALHLDDIDGQGAVVNRVANHHPVWTYTTAARVRQYQLGLMERKIIPVGRAGLFAPVDGEAEIAYLEGLAAGNVPFKELYRRHVEPPVIDDDGSASLTDFVLR